MAYTDIQSNNLSVPQTSTVYPGIQEDGNDDLLIAVAGAVFGFPIFVIFLICVLRIRMHYAEKRMSKANCMEDGTSMIRRYTNSGGSFSCRSTGTSICHEASTSGAHCERQCLAKNENAASDEEECLSSEGKQTVIKTNAIVSQGSKGSSHKHKNKSKKHLFVPNGESVQRASVSANGSEKDLTTRSESKRRENDATAEVLPGPLTDNCVSKIKDSPNDRILEVVV